MSNRKIRLLAAAAILFAPTARAQDFEAIIQPPTWHSVVYNTASTNTYTPKTGVVWVQGCGGGGAGGGGNATGGGGGGGGSSPMWNGWPLPVTPGVALTATLPAAALGGTVGNPGANGGFATITGGAYPMDIGIGTGGGAGQAANGGNGGTSQFGANIQNSGAPAGGAGAGSSPQSSALNTIGAQLMFGMPGGPGAGTGAGGGAASRSMLSTSTIPGGTGVGGGAGGGTLFGDGAAGGNASSVGANAANNCAGGGGGGQNAAGGNGGLPLVILSENY